MYHDETDITIRGRGLDYTFTRTYNSAPVKPDLTGKPLGSRWTHSYNMRLITNDYGQHPNFEASQAPVRQRGSPPSETPMQFLLDNRHNRANVRGWSKGFTDCDFIKIHG